MHIFLVFLGGYDRVLSAVFTSINEAIKHREYLIEEYNLRSDDVWIEEEPLLEYASDFPNKRNL